MLNLVYNENSDTPIDEVDYENNVRVTKLGRELVIPQAQLTYRNSTIFLYVYINDTSSVSGNATRTLQVVPSELKPVFGFGARSIAHNAS